MALKLHINGWEFLQQSQNFKAGIFLFFATCDFIFFNPSHCTFPVYLSKNKRSEQ